MKALVTGASGFLGNALARRLKARGFSRSEAAGVEWVKGDVADAGAVRSAVKGCDVVFHTAARVGLWGSYEDFRRANVEGTRNVIEACREAGVRRLVFTGSPSVVFDGGDVEGIDERAPYASSYDSFYSRTKALSEELVLTAAGVETVSLRPHLIWGPGDRHIAPRLIERAKRGKLRRIAGKDCLVDTTYIDDCVEAHVLAASAPGAGGKAYFISQGDPRPLWSIINGILDAAGLPPVTRSVPYPAAVAAAWVLEAVWKAAGLRGEPPLTRFLVKQLSTAHWFDISAARRDLGYAPKVSIEEGLQRLKAAFSTGSMSS